MGKLIDLTGQRFGRLTVIGRAARKGKNTYWLCRCDCGAEKEISRCNLLSGTQSCGCLRAEKTINRHITHGKSSTKLYGVWKAMLERCYEPKTERYPIYGGRGIEVCDEWRKDFKVFYDWALSHGYSYGLTLDRIEVNGAYCPENCRWVTRIEQQNNMRTNHFVTFKGQTKTIAEWSRETGIDQHVLGGRIRNGWSVERAMKEPVIKRKPN